MRFFWLFASLIVAQSAVAAQKPIRFWNLTAKTVTQFRLAPAGSAAFGADLCADDKDGSVDHDERLSLPGIAPGRHDIKIGYADGRTCRIGNVEFVAGEVFSIEAKDLKDCARP